MEPCLNGARLAPCLREGGRVRVAPGRDPNTTLTALGAILPEWMLRAFSRHRDSRSLDRYSKPRPTPQRS